ncbi:hypothetical protein MSA03_19150 [Microbacterium saccharophilum]|nr:hypothetical protein MSA03_19150 [Microbacterium saccharophilum]
MAKRPAKNMTSLPSHTMVPTATGSGRLTDRKAWGYVAEEVVTHPIMADIAARFSHP